MLTRKKLDHLIARMVKIYGDIETALLNLIADYLKKGDIDDVSEIYQWQAEHIAQAPNVVKLPL